MLGIYPASGRYSGDPFGGMSVTPAQFARLFRSVNELAEEQSEILGPFIAGPEPLNPVAAHYHRYTRWVCDSYAQVPDWVRNASPAVSQAVIESTIGASCRQYLGSGMPSAVPPFIGGQCVAQYQANYTVRQIRKSTGETVATQAYSSLAFGPTGLTPQGPAVTGMTRRDFSGQVQWYVDFQNGRWYANLIGSRDRSTTTFDYFVESFSFRRVDGLPDNCGNKRPQFPTPSPTRPSDPGPNPPGGGQPPLFGPRGTPIFRPGPFRSPYDEPDEPCPPIDPYYPREGDDDDPYYGPDRPEPGDPGDPGAPVVTGPGGEAEGEAPADTELYGLKVDLVVVPPFAKEYAPGVYRGAIYAYMGAPVGLDQDYAGSMLRSGQFILAERPGLTKWRVEANVGYSVRVTPYYREVI